MAADGKIDLHSFRILSRREEKGFPFLLCTRLYPEWPLAVVRHTDIELAEQVAVALITMPHHSPAAKAGKSRAGRFRSTISRCMTCRKSSASARTGITAG